MSEANANAQQPALAQPMVGRKIYYGWIVVAALLLIMTSICGYLMFATAVVDAQMILDLKFSREVLGLMVGGFSLVSGVSGPAIALLVSRFGTRVMLATFSIGLVVCSLCMTAIVQPWQAIVVFSLMSLCLPGTMMAVQTCTVRWFVKRRALALALVMSGFALGGGIFSPVAALLMERSGSWRAGWWLGIGLGGVAFVLALLVVREYPQSMGLLPDGGVADGERTPATSSSAVMRPPKWKLAETVAVLKVVARTPAYWSIVALTLCSVAVALYRSHGIVHLRDVGFTAQGTAASLSIFTAAMLASKVIAGLLGDHIEMRFIAGGGMVLGAVGLWLLIGADASRSLTVMAIALGLGFGLINVALPTLYANYFGVAIFPLLIGIGTFLSAPLGMVINWGAGATYDRFHSYTAAFGISALACLLAALVVIAFGAPPKKVAAPL